VPVIDVRSRTSALGPATIHHSSIWDCRPSPRLGRARHERAARVLRGGLATLLLGLNRAVLEPQRSFRHEDPALDRFPFYVATGATHVARFAGKSRSADKTWFDACTEKRVVWLSSLAGTPRRDAARCTRWLTRCKQKPGRRKILEIPGSDAHNRDLAKLEVPPQREVANLGRPTGQSILAPSAGLERRRSSLGSE
jgi:hypothetical protein